MAPKKAVQRARTVYHCPQSERWWPLTPTVVLNGLLVCSTLLLVITAAIQGWAFIASERAFLTIDQIGFEKGVPLAGSSPRVIYALKNSGRGNAVIEGFSLNFSEALPPNPRYAQTRLSVKAVPGGVISTGVAEPVGVDGRIKILNDIDVKAINSKHAPFFVYGYIYYRDDFSGIPLFGKMATGFCYVYEPNIGGQPRFDACAEENYSYVRRRADTSEIISTGVPLDPTNTLATPGVLFPVAPSTTVSPSSTPFPKQIPPGENQTPPLR